jgi:hypothetical protein
MKPFPGARPSWPLLLPFYTKAFVRSPGLRTRRGANRASPEDDDSLCPSDKRKQIPGARPSWPLFFPFAQARAQRMCTHVRHPRARMRSRRRPGIYRRPRSETYLPALALPTTLIATASSPLNLERKRDYRRSFSLRHSSLPRLSRRFWLYTKAFVRSPGQPRAATSTMLGQIEFRDWLKRAVDVFWRGCDRGRQTRAS